MNKKRFDVLKDSKFDVLSPSDMKSVTGGVICINCMKRKKNWPVGLGGRSGYADEEETATDNQE